MDKIIEVKRLKKLLDDGIITEEDFVNQKRKIFELEELNNIVEDDITIENKRKSLDDYETELVKESETKEKDSMEEYYKKEKLKEKAKLDAKEEIRKQRAEDKNKQIRNGINICKNIFKWILTIFLMLMGIGSFMSIADVGIIYLASGILFILLSLMTCPLITENTKKFKKYIKYKKTIVFIVIIIIVVLMCIAGVKITAQKMI